MTTGGDLNGPLLQDTLHFAHKHAITSSLLLSHPPIRPPLPRAHTPLCPRVTPTLPPQGVSRSPSKNTTPRKPQRPSSLQLDSSRHVKAPAPCVHPRRDPLAPSVRSLPTPLKQKTRSASWHQRPTCPPSVRLRLAPPGTHLLLRAEPRRALAVPAPRRRQAVRGVQRFGGYHSMDR